MSLIPTLNIIYIIFTCVCQRYFLLLFTIKMLEQTCDCKYIFIIMGGAIGICEMYCINKWQQLIKLSLSEINKNNYNILNN